MRRDKTQREITSAKRQNQEAIFHTKEQECKMEIKNNIPTFFLVGNIVVVTHDETPEKMFVFCEKEW